MAYYIPIITCLSLFLPDVSRIHVVLEDGFAVSKDCFVACKGSSCPPLPKQCYHELHSLTVAKHWFFPDDILKYSTRVLNRVRLGEGVLLRPDVSRFDKFSFRCGDTCATQGCYFENMLYAFGGLRFQTESPLFGEPSILDCLGCYCNVTGVSNYHRVYGGGYHIVSDRAFCPPRGDSIDIVPYSSNLLFSGEWSFGVVKQNDSDPLCTYRLISTYISAFSDKESAGTAVYADRYFMIPRGEVLYTHQDLFVFEYNHGLFFMSQLCLEQAFAYLGDYDFNVTCHGTHCFYDGFDYNRLRRKCLILLDASKSVNDFALLSLLYTKTARCEIPTRLDYLVDIPVSRSGDQVTLFRVYGAESAYVFERLPAVDYSVRIQVATVDTSIISALGHYVLTVFIRAFVYVVVDVLLALAKSILTTIIEFGGCCFKIFLFSLLDLFLVLILTLNTLTKISVFVFWVFCIVIRIWSSSCCLDLHNLFLDYVDN